jgi:protein-S-isoprenylcysteine O-methyltransferase Ste14
MILWLYNTIQQSSTVNKCMDKRKKPAIAGSAVFLAVPAAVAVGIPWWIDRGRVNSAILNWPAVRWFGVLVVAIGAIGLLDSFSRFALEGIGTPAPVYPTRHLVIRGFYRYVRNPMYVSVVLAILGQGLVFGNVMLLAYGALVWLLFHAFVVLYEEPTLTATFGEEYKSFCARVPRWIPRFRRLQ